MLNFRLIYITWMHFGGSKLLELSHMIAEFHTQIRNNSCIQFGLFFFFKCGSWGGSRGGAKSAIMCRFKMAACTACNLFYFHRKRFKC